MASGLAVPVRRLHDYQPAAAGRAARRLLQPARHLRAAHQGREEHDQMDAASPVRLQLRALAYKLGYFMRMLVMPKTAEPWLLTSFAREAAQDRRNDHEPR